MTAASPKRLQNGNGVANRDPLAQQILQHPLHRGQRQQLGHQIFHHLGMLDATRSSSLLASCRENSSWAWRRTSSARCVPSTLTASTTVYPAARACSARSIGNPPGRQCRRPARAWRLPSSGRSRCARGDGQFAALRQLVAGDLRRPSARSRIRGCAAPGCR